MYYYNHMSGLGYFGMILFWIIFLIIIIWLIIQQQINKEKTPNQINKERYARGEINKNEYEEINKRIN